MMEDISNIIVCKCSFIFLFILLISCEQKKNKLTFDDCPVIATKSNSLVTLDITQVKDTFDIRLSALLESFEIVFLENKEQALIGQAMAFSISENYIGLYNTLPADYKLFDKKGKYICSLSSRGQGPDDFFAICDSYIDEINQRVYILSYMTDKLLVYDLSGNSLGHIRFPFRVHKARFLIDAEKQQLIMFALPFEDTPYVIWCQDFEGNVLQSINSENFKIIPGDYSNEINESFNTDEVDFSLFHWLPQNDTLYHYDIKKNSLESIFTIDWGSEEIERHDYTEIDEYYLIRLVTQSATFAGTPRHPQILLNKNSLKGCYVNFKFNMLGNIDGLSWLSFNRGYCIGNMYPYQLKEQLQKALSKPESITPDMRTKLREMDRKLTDDDNNIIFIGKLKGYPH